MPSREKAIENDLTKGDAARQLIRYAIPMVTTSVLQALYSMADMIIAGHFIGIPVFPRSIIPARL